MNDSFYKRTRHGHQPGDVSRQIKIEMREKKNPITIRYAKDCVEVIPQTCAKAYRKMVNRRGNRRFRHQKIAAGRAE